ncbi:hypothetical protein FK220_010085 [Flavobacteriaceae bacterium TP-CH-4]|uniref:Uncharacterized protein n=1 Tax=Pelagihabitans pacificus TaxID=2696054 RepID=A0A967ASS2_9FLAO|nr:hypothetical protein [Pelagihabitans pacificus]NHF59691.1 hypothetical protein [Pelagihabitans pacificus]
MGKNKPRYRHDFTGSHRVVGKTAAWTVSALLLVYVFTTTIGLVSLPSPETPIGDPFFTLMELLTLLIAPLMLLCMIAVHAYASPGNKAFSSMALICMLLMTGITSSVHFVVLTVGHPMEMNAPELHRNLFSFKWPSLVYALDILAWDWFYALSMLLAAPVFGTGKLQKKVRMLMIASGVLSLAGLLGVPLDDMRIRNIGIIGYAVIAPVVFLLLGRVFERAGTSP